MPPVFMGWIFTVIGSVWISVSVITGILTAISGRYISKRTHKTFSTVIAGINCLFIPVGTALGMFAIITLGNKEVLDLYDGKQDVVNAPEIA